MTTMTRLLVLLSATVLGAACGPAPESKEPATTSPPPPAELVSRPDGFAVLDMGTWTEAHGDHGGITTPRHPR